MPSSAVLSFSDPYEYQQAIAAADVQIVPSAPGSFDATLTRIKLDRLWMQRGRFSLPTVTHSVVSSERTMIFLQLDPDQRPVVHSGVEVPPDQIVAYSQGSDHHYRASEDCHWGAMSLKTADFAAVSEILVGRALKPPPVTRILRPPERLMSRLLSLHKAAGDLAATAPQMLAHPEVGGALEQELVRAMIACLIDPETEERMRTIRLRRPIMQKFEQMLQERKFQPLYVTDICAGIGVTDRTLRLHCQEYLGMSSHHYLWLRRMKLVRRALAAADAADVTVTEVANDHGFGELGRFAVAYRKLFGELPSATLRRTPGI